MGIITLYYFIGFIVFIVCLGAIQKWSKLPQQKRYKVGLIVLCIFLFSLVGFFFLVLSGTIHFPGDYIISFGMLFFFLFILFGSFFLTWYNEKYDKKINIGAVIVVFCLSVFAIAFLYLKNMSSSQKDDLVNNLELKTVVNDITFDPHKPYFKNMLLADGQYLPMPETMNYKLQVGDSIFKMKGEKYYTVVNNKTKLQSYYLVSTHTRVLSKPQ